MPEAAQEAGVKDLPQPHITENALETLERKAVDAINMLLDVEIEAGDIANRESSDLTNRARNLASALTGVEDLRNEIFQNLPNARLTLKD